MTGESRTALCADENGLVYDTEDSSNGTAVTLATCDPEELPNLVRNCTVEADDDEDSEEGEGMMQVTSEGKLEFRKMIITHEDL